MTVTKAGSILFAVLDTNIVLSALLFNNSQLSQLRNLWQQQKFVPLASKATISELIRVLAYPKFKLTPSQQQDLLADYLPFVKTITQVKPSNIACRDENDVMFLDLAVAGVADFLVTGDQDLLVLKPQELSQEFNFKIITPASFLQLF